MLNKIMIMGRLTSDVELRSTQSGKNVAAFTVAVDRDFKPQGGERETDFINCVAWNGTADFVSKYFHKGSMAIVSGRLQTRRYETSDKQKRTATEVIVENLYFGESKKENGNNAQSFTPQDGNGYSDTSAPSMNVPDGFTPVDDSDLPF